MTNQAWAAWAIKNSVVVMCWTSLAVFFGKWWIALFGVLFLSSIKTESARTCYCDQCGQQLPFSGTFEELVKAKQAAGWVRRKNGEKWEDICPQCQRGYKEEKSV